MASGPPPGDPYRRPARRRPGEGLRALGDQMDGGSRLGDAAGRPSGAGGGASRSEERLQALGARVDDQGRGGRHRGGGRRRGGGRGRTGGHGGGRRRSVRRKVVTSLLVLLLLAVVAGAGVYGYARYRFDQIQKLHVSSEVAQSTGAPFNMLVIGSDTRVGNSKGTTHYGTSTEVGGQRSDVTMVWHVVPSTKQITILSIPRDSLVSMVGKNVTTFGHLNRINASFNSGPTLLVKTIEANFGIPISHVVEVDFGGLANAVNAVGGIHMDFPYAARTYNPTTGVNETGLDIATTGCQLLTGTKALAVVRSRHYEYEDGGTWVATEAGDLGRIKRQDAFLKALIDQAKSEYNPLKLNSLLASIPQGIEIDTSFSLGDLVSLAEAFHSVNPTTIRTETLPTLNDGYVTPWGDILFVDEPAAQQMLVSVFGSELTHPTAPPPDQTLVPTTPPAVTASAPVAGSPGATAATSTKGSTSSTAPVTAPTTFDPTACT